MRTSHNIHSANSDGLSFEADEPARDNSNAITLAFESNAEDGWRTGRSEVTIFGLSNVTADCLSAIGRMDESMREAALIGLLQVLEPE